jgi:hypothetical protein
LDQPQRHAIATQFATEIAALYAEGSQKSPPGAIADCPIVPIAPCPVVAQSLHKA